MQKALAYYFTKKYRSLGARTSFLPSVFYSCVYLFHFPMLMVLLFHLCYSQVSTNLLRKYSGPVDIWLSLLYAMSSPSGQIHCLLNQHPYKSYAAMAQHMSQWVWYVYPCAFKILFMSASGWNGDWPVLWLALFPFGHLKWNTCPTKWFTIYSLCANLKSPISLWDIINIPNVMISNMFYCWSLIFFFGSQCIHSKELKSNKDS